jgi:hypothetical protein
MYLQVKLEVAPKLNLCFIPYKQEYFLRTTQMTLFLNRSLMFFFLIAIFMPIAQTDAVWQQPPHQFSATGAGIAMASDATGNAITVLDNAGIVEAFFYSSISNAWSGPTILGTDNGLIAMDMDASGTALAVWVAPNGTDLHSAFFNGTTWTSGSPDPFASAQAIGDLTVTMNGPNTAMATWINTLIAQGFSSFFTSGSWGAPINLTLLGVSSPLSSDFSSDGTAVASFMIGSNLTIATFNGVSWGGSFTSDPSVLANNVARIDANGHAVVVWVNIIPDNVNARFFNGTVWSSAVVISNTSGNVPTSLSFDMAPSGTGVATWVDGAGVGFSSSFNGTAWSTPQQFAPSVSSSHTSVSVNASGDALLLFQVPGGTIFSARLPLGGVWTAPELVATPSNTVSLLISSLSNNGFGFAAWPEGVQPFNYFATVDRPFVPPPPPSPTPPAPPTSINGASCNDKFATQTDCIHSFIWTASPTPSVVAYQIMRNGVLIATIPASAPLIFVDHNRCKRTDVYTVIALDANGLSSTPVGVIVPSR